MALMEGGAISIEYRLYTLVNMYLSPIQHGIQTAHIVSELFTNYEQIDIDDYARSTGGGPIPEFTISRAHAANVLFEWGNEHKTIIVLNGGYQCVLEDTYDQFESLGNQLQLPHAKFREEAISLNSAMTAVGIVVPSSIYDIKWPEDDIAIFLDTIENPYDLNNIDSLGRKIALNCTELMVTEKELAALQLKHVLNQFKLA